MRIVAGLEDFVITAADGATITDANGRTYVDYHVASRDDLPANDYRRWLNYSWQAVEHFSSTSARDTELCWLLGDDQWRAIDTWARPELLAARVHFIVFPRGQTAVSTKPGFRHLVIEARHPASATAVREAVRRGRTLEGLVPPKVAAYIHQHRLYLEPFTRVSS